MMFQEGDQKSQLIGSKSVEHGQSGHRQLKNKPSGLLK